MSTAPDFWPTHQSAQKTASPSQSEAFARLDAEMFFGHQLWKRGGSADPFAGLTTRSERIARIRAAIIDLGLGSAIIGKGRHGLPESFSEAFQRAFGEKL